MEHLNICAGATRCLRLTRVPGLVCSHFCIQSIQDALTDSPDTISQPLTQALFDFPDPIGFVVFTEDSTRWFIKQYEDQAAEIASMRREGTQTFSSDEYTGRYTNDRNNFVLENSTWLQQQHTRNAFSKQKVPAVRAETFARWYFWMIFVTGRRSKTGNVPYLKCWLLSGWISCKSGRVGLYHVARKTLEEDWMIWFGDWYFGEIDTMHSTPVQVSGAAGPCGLPSPHPKCPKCTRGCKSSAL